MARHDDESGPLPPLPPSVEVLLATTFGAPPRSRPKPGWREHGAPSGVWGDAERLAVSLEALLARRREAVRSLWIDHESDDIEEIVLNDLARGRFLEERVSTDADELAAIDAALAKLAPHLPTIDALVGGNASPREHTDRLCAGGVAELGAALAELRAMDRGEDVDGVCERADAALRRILAEHVSSVEAPALDHPEARAAEPLSNVARTFTWLLGSLHVQSALGLLTRAFPEVSLGRMLSGLREAASIESFRDALRNSRAPRPDDLAMRLLDDADVSSKSTLQRARRGAGVVNEERARRGAHRGR